MKRVLLDIRHWEMLLAIEAAGTMRAAATNMNITQSALSHRLAEAERRLGNALYHREGRRLAATVAGRALTGTARQLLPALSRAETDFIAMAQGSAAVVRFGVAAYNAYGWLPGFLKANQTKHKIQLEVVAAATQQPIRSLLDGHSDLVVAPTHLASPGVVAIPLFEDELVLIVPRGHRLAKLPYLEAKHLRDEKYLTYSRTTEPGFEYERFVRPSGVLPKSITTIEMTDAIVELVVNGFGVSILARWAIRPAAAAKRIQTVQVGDKGLDLPWAVLLREADMKGSAAREMADLLVNWCQSRPPDVRGV